MFPKCVRERLDFTAYRVRAGTVFFPRKRPVGMGAGSKCGFKDPRVIISSRARYRRSPWTPEGLCRSGDGTAVVPFKEIVRSIMTKEIYTNYRYCLIWTPTRLGIMLVL